MMNTLILLLVSTFKYATEHLESLATLFVAFAGYKLSKEAHDRDQGRLDLTIYSAEERDGENLKLIARGAMITIVNSGRRPIVVSSLISDAKGNYLKRFVSLILSYRTPSTWRPSAFTFDHPSIQGTIRPNGTGKMLNESELISIYLSGKAGESMIETLATKSRNFYVLDSTQKKHYLSKSVFRKLKYDWFKYHVATKQQKA